MYYHRKSARIPNYDYSGNNYYFITICTYHRQCIFGNPNQLNWLGQIVERHILNIPSHYEGVRIDKFVVMPNHIHLIIALENGEKNPDIRYLVALLKTGITKEIRNMKPGMEVWQRSFHDHIIRNQKSFEKIWLYIEDNPRKWEQDCFYRKTY